MSIKHKHPLPKHVNIKYPVVFNRSLWNRGRKLSRKKRLVRERVCLCVGESKSCCKKREQGEVDNMYDSCNTAVNIFRRWSLSVVVAYCVI